MSTEKQSLPWDDPAADPLQDVKDYATRLITDIQIESISLDPTPKTNGPCQHWLQYSEQASSKGDLLWVCSNCGAEKPPGSDVWWIPDFDEGKQ